MQPSPTTHEKVLKAFKDQQSSLAKWCRENGVSYPWARACLLGTGTGYEATALFERIIHAAGMASKSNPIGTKEHQPRLPLEA